jgi:hypothetical protein
MGHTIVTGVQFCRPTRHPPKGAFAFKLKAKCFQARKVLRARTVRGERQTDRQTDRQTVQYCTRRERDRQTDRETERQRDRETERQTDKQTDRQFSTVQGDRKIDR